MSAWIDFNELRSKLSFEQILRHYNVEVKRKGDQHHGYCPLPNHKGVRNSASFSASLKRGIFQCFGCRASGNLLDFAALMEKVEPKDGPAVRKVAIKLRDKFCPETGNTEKREAKPPEKKDVKQEPEKEMPLFVNVPLNFELKGLDQTHPYLLGRRFTKETIARFGLGLCSRGFLKGRIAIPLYDKAGALIGYAGRVIDDEAIDEENPKYMFPSSREREGNVYEFRKSLFLYNGHRITKPLDDLIVVEGFASVWWLTQLSRENVVSTMGAAVSAEQAMLLIAALNPWGRLWLVSDGDPAGERWAKEVLAQVAPERFCRWVKLPHGKQPTHYDGAYYRQVLG